MGMNFHARTMQPEIKGVCLVQQAEGGLVLTEDAVRLVDAYRAGEGWEVLLALQLLKYSPRCRAVFFPLCSGGIFYNGNLLTANLSKTELHFNNQVYLPFAAKKNDNDMNRLLADFREAALGHYWRKVFDESGISLPAEWFFAGSNGPSPACTNMSSLMRSPVVLFDYLDWFVKGAGGEVRLNKTKLEEDLQGEEIFNGLRFRPVSILDTFRDLIDGNRDYRGFFPVEPVLEKMQSLFYPDWQEGLDRFIDYYITDGINQGQFQIEAHESGQPRHGRGYLGKRDYQLIKLQFFK